MNGPLDTQILTDLSTKATKDAMKAILRSANLAPNSFAAATIILSATTHLVRIAIEAIGNTVPPSERSAVMKEVRTKIQEALGEPMKRVDE